MKSIFLVLMFCLSLVGLDQGANIDSLLHQGRIYFYKAVPEKQSVDKGIKIFEKIAVLDTTLQGRAQTYLGALTMLRGKHATWPHTKFNLVMQGLKEMDAGLVRAGDDIEALFVHGTTCYYLPFFFSRKDDATRDFERLIQLLPTQYQKYDKTLMHNVIDFLQENTQLTDAEQEQLRILEEQLEDAL